MNKFMIYAVNSSPQDVLENGAINPGSVVHRYGCNNGHPSAVLDANGVQVQGIGYYRIDGTVQLVPEADGLITVTLYANNEPVEGASASATGVAGNTITLPIVGEYLRPCNCVRLTNFVCKVSGAATVNNYTIRIVGD